MGSGGSTNNTQNIGNEIDHVMNFIPNINHNVSTHGYDERNCLVVTGIGLPETEYAGNGKIFQFRKSNFELFIKKTWNFPIITIPDYFYQPGDTLHFSQEFENAMKSILHVKDGRGSVLRAQNTRTKHIGAVSLWCIQRENSPSNELLYIGCWNPLEYCSTIDWETDDTIQLLDDSQTYITDICNSFEFVLLDIYICSHFIALTPTEYNLTGEYAEFSKCGIIGRNGGELKLESVMSGRCNLYGIRTDTSKLPFSVYISDSLDDPNSNNTSAMSADPSCKWTKILSNCYGPFVKCHVCGIRRLCIQWDSTLFDLLMLDGLFNPLGGGGLHAELYVTASQ